jgi:nucleotide-binding universal stress UspA family protein
VKQPREEADEMSVHTNQPIIVGISELDSNTDVLGWAAAEASRRRAPLEVVFSGYYVVGPVYSATDETAAEPVGSMQRLIKESIAFVKARFPALQVTSNLHEGDPATYLIDQSRRCALIVLGTHGGSPITGAVLHSITQSVASHSRCPVVAVNDVSIPDVVARPAVVVGVSPSVAGSAALRFAFEQAQSRGDSLIALRSWGYAKFGIARLGLMPSILDDWQRMEMRVLDECVDPLAAEYPDVHVEKRLREERPQWALQQEGLGTDLLVVGAHRSDDHWFSRLGPIASWLLHRAPCPIAVVGQPDPKSAQDSSSSDLEMAQP